MPIDVTGVFTDQGVVNEQTVGKPVGQRTVIRIESNDRNVSELYFTPPGETSSWRFALCTRVSNNQAVAKLGSAAHRGLVRGPEQASCQPRRLAAERLPLNLTHTLRHARPCAGHPRLCRREKDVKAGTSSGRDGMIQCERVPR